MPSAAQKKVVARSHGEKEVSHFGYCDRLPDSCRHAEPTLIRPFIVINMLNKEVKTSFPPLLRATKIHAGGVPLNRK
jgi:hypothetical protein